ncbi:MAG: hypothetical protein ACTHJQ_22815 [Rhizobiaceae bacterium]
MSEFSKEYRNQFVAEVKSLPRDKYGRISRADFNRLNARIHADRKSGSITHHDFYNCGCVIGSAVNIARHLDPATPDEVNLSVVCA